MTRPILSYLIPSDRRYDLPSVRELVILEPQWIIDAVSMVIRNYEQEAHRKPCDEDAAREVPRDWTALKNEAKLSRALLEYLWGDKWGETRFKDHKEKLLQLMTHFGLVVPIKGKGVATFIVPALLSFSANNAMRPPKPDGALSIKLHFAIAGTVLPEHAPLWTADDVERGFLPDSAFHELCGSAVGWSNHTTKGFSATIGRGFAHVKFGPHELLLERGENEPFVVVTLLKCKHEPSAAAPPIDRLRLLVDNVRNRFVNLRCTVLLDLTTTNPDGFITGSVPILLMY